MKKKRRRGGGMKGKLVKNTESTLKMMRIM